MKKCVLKLTTDSEKYIKPSQLRGYFAKKFPDIDLFHQYNENGENIYRYPRIQYKNINNNIIIFALNEGIDPLKKIFLEVDVLNVENNKIKIIEKNIKVKKDMQLEVLKNYEKYKFITPWVALNQKNYKKYKNTDNYSDKKNLLERIMIGNILSVCKSFDIWIEEKIKINIEKFKTVKVNSLHFENLMGFYVDFKTNFKLFDLLSLGKQVSKGFGVVKKRSS